MADNTNSYTNNVFIEMAVDQFHKTTHIEAFYTILDVLYKRINEGGEAPTPMVVSSGRMPVLQISENATAEDLNALVGQEMKLEEDVRLKIDTMMDGQGKIWIPLFTSEDELHKQPTANIVMNIPISEILMAGRGDKVEGVVINPFGQSVMLPKEAIDAVLNIHPD